MQLQKLQMFLINDFTNKHILQLMYNYSFSILKRRKLQCLFSRDVPDRVKNYLQTETKMYHSHVILFFFFVVRVANTSGILKDNAHHPYTD